MSLVGSSARSVLAPGGEETRPKKCLEHMGNVFHGGKFTDVTIVCHGREFPCHKAILLTGRPPVFEAMFSNNFKEAGENRVEVVEDIAADTFGEMHVFMYSGKVTNLDKKAENLLLEGEKNDLREFKQRYEESLCINL